MIEGGYAKTKLGALGYFNEPQERVYWLFLLSAAVIAFVVFFIKVPNARRRPTSGFFRFLFPKAVWLHPSAVVDYFYFVFNISLFSLVITPLMIGSNEVGRAVRMFFERYLGVGPYHLEPSWVPELFTATVAFLALDFGIFLSHYLQHRIPLLWEFHKVHHSAQVMTPITVYRMHPVDDILSLTVSALIIGVVTGTTRSFLGSGVNDAAAFGINVTLYVFYLAGYNLRHSHVWLSYGERLSRYFISPAQHQIHHSSEQRHWDKNFGFLFAIWDRSFGTLYIPRTREVFRLGLPKGEDREYSNPMRLYLLPFKKAWKLLRR